MPLDNSVFSAVARQRSRRQQIRLGLFILHSLIFGAVLAATIAAQRNGSSGRAVMQRAVGAAEAFLDSLTPEQRALATLALNAKKRATWSNLPGCDGVIRNGLPLMAMTPAQEMTAMALVAAALSPEGFHKVMAIVDAEEAREQRTLPQSRVQGTPWRRQFCLAVLGQPSTGRTWMLQFGGHHLALNVTFVRGRPVVTPMHTGADPASYSLGAGTVRPLGDETDAAFALLKMRRPEQREQAVVGRESHDLVVGPGEDAKTIAPTGIKASTLTTTQREQLLTLIGAWVQIADTDTAAQKLAEVRSHLDDTYFLWSGATLPGSLMYFRVQGPTVLIEYSMQEPNHVHTIYRDPSNDYGGITF